MTEANVLTELRYARLVGDIRKLLQESRENAKNAANQDLILTYWQIGKRIAQEKLTDKAYYGESVLHDIAQDIGMDLRTLQRCLVFYNTYGAAPRKKNLTWSHYRELMNIKDEDERRYYEDLISEQPMTRDQLVKLIKTDHYEKNQTLESESTATDIQLIRPDDPTYVYKAQVVRVLDNQALQLQIDLGFGVLKNQRVRLADVRLWPMDDDKGREAYDYIRNQMAIAPFVVVKIDMVDINGRFMAHLFYSFKETDIETVYLTGRYLNQELVNKGFVNNPG